MTTFIIIDCTSKSLLGKNFIVDLSKKGPYILNEVDSRMSFRVLKHEQGILTLINSNLKIIGRQV